MGACLRCPPRSPAQSWVTEPHPVVSQQRARSSCLSSPPTGLCWADKELMNEDSETVLEPEGRHRSQLLTRLYCWVSPRRGCPCGPQGQSCCAAGSRAAQPACLQSRVLGDVSQASVSPSAIGGSCLAGGRRNRPWGSVGSWGLQETPLITCKCPALGSFSWPLAPGPARCVQGKAQIWRDRRKLGEEQEKPPALLVGEELRPGSPGGFCFIHRRDFLLPRQGRASQGLQARLGYPPASGPAPALSLGSS